MKRFLSWKCVLTTKISKSVQESLPKPQLPKNAIIKNLISNKYILPLGTLHSSPRAPSRTSQQRNPSSKL